MVCQAQPHGTCAAACEGGSRVGALARRHQRGGAADDGRRDYCAARGAWRELQGGGTATECRLASGVHLPDHPPRPDDAAVQPQLGCRQRAVDHQGVLGAHRRRRPQSKPRVGQLEHSAPLGEACRRALHAAGGARLTERHPYNARDEAVVLHGPLARLSGDRAVWCRLRVCYGGVPAHRGGGAAALHRREAERRTAHVECARRLRPRRLPDHH
mmetsp:Transcript_48500/g.134461  ORF Transcript_48500/g.134461 Transcript_48500/m.134461 type:complete len:214 (+) Transcript_48500:2420-3061(+)